MTRLLVATASSADYRFVARAVASDPQFVLLPQAAGLMETFSAVEEQMPHVVLIERTLTRRAEFELMRALFETHDVRWLVWDQRTVARQQSACAIRSGADLFVLDSSMPPAQLLAQLKSVALSRRAAVATPQSAGAPTPRQPDRMILIGASTGGVDALITVLSSFPANCPATVIVQHTGPKFGPSLVKLLDLRCQAAVVQAEPGLELAAGRVIVAAGTAGHAALTGRTHDRISIEDSSPVNGHKPSVDVLFHSAVPAAKRVVATLLTGMGRDGANGLRALRDGGARTSAQDEATSVVYGMPRAAWEMNAAERQLALEAVGPTLISTATSGTHAT